MTRARYWGVRSRGQGAIRHMKQRCEQIVELELQRGDDALAEHRIADPPRRHADLVEKELAFHVESSRFHFVLEFALLVTSEMANLAIEFAEQSRVVRHEEYKTTLIRQGVPQVLQNGSILLNVLQDVQTYNRIRLVLA